MDNRTVIVTGGNTGLGYQAAKAIASSDAGYYVVLACRDTPRGDAAAAAMRSETGSPHITSMPLDLASLDSVRAFAESFSDADLPPLYGIVCNAGISAAGVPGALGPRRGSRRSSPSTTSDTSCSPTSCSPTWIRTDASSS